MVIPFSIHRRPRDQVTLFDVITRSGDVPSVAQFDLNWLIDLIELAVLVGESRRPIRDNEFYSLVTESPA
jgi:hypothetical protein